MLPFTKTNKKNVPAVDKNEEHCFLQAAGVLKFDYIEMHRILLDVIRD